mmetsp:Transcript_30695/g.75497  ORF Transcript_30695/g.75497 Transcript_30695/m.75497 type:complete len:251 (-) Transcript_30695:414-1166(-)
MLTKLLALSKPPAAMSVAAPSVAANASLALSRASAAPSVAANAFAPALATACATMPVFSITEFSCITAVDAAAIAAACITALLLREYARLRSRLGLTASAISLSSLAISPLRCLREWAVMRWPCSPSMRFTLSSCSWLTVFSLSSLRYTYLWMRSRRRGSPSKKPRNFCRSRNMKCERVDVVTVRCEWTSAGSRDSSPKKCGDVSSALVRPWRVHATKPLEIMKSPLAVWPSCTMTKPIDVYSCLRSPMS